ncbi:hypothetical protein H072_5062 [Dactylellina haptotyla CBS 200.50]|uniref:Uncharacterized protein n=1 Tax=Dactylellina haptotyla (strain CBS 200.50) TaxID=1284197 RepID=S8ADG1_DACHA|nr:hypothetical protein H072_5062 [Dactylellina haptotyla CBS 200.50]
MNLKKSPADFFVEVNGDFGRRADAEAHFEALHSWYRNYEDANFGYCPKYRDVPKFEDKTNLSKYNHPLYQQPKPIASRFQNPGGSSSYGPPTSPRMGYGVYGQSVPSLALAGTPHNPVLDYSHGHPNAYQFPPNQEDEEHQSSSSWYTQGPSQTVNIKERSSPASNVKLRKSTTRAKAARRVQFAGLETVEELEDAPIPCNPEDCPDSRLALEDGRLLHTLAPETPYHKKPASSHDTFHKRPSTLGVPLNTNNDHSTHFSSGYNQDHTNLIPASASASASRRRSQIPCLGSANIDLHPTSNKHKKARRTRHPHRQSLPAQFIAEVEGDNTFPTSHSDQGNLVPSFASIGLSSTPSPSHQESPNEIIGSGSSWLEHDRTGRWLHIDSAEFLTDFSTKKPKEIFKKLLGGRTTRPCDTGVSHFTEKYESNQIIRYANLEARKEWAFVAISPDSKSIVGVCDHDHFMTYSMDDSGIRMRVGGEFEGEPQAIAISNNHLAILTLNKLQVFDHHIGRRVYEWTSDKTVAAENFTSIAFANNGLELCAGLTNGTIQFHYVPLENQDFDPEDVTFRRGDPRMDITLSSGDYAFTMSFSDDDMRFACGTQKRMLLVYQHRGSSWELRNKFKFNDWEPGTHRRISGAIFCPDNRFLFATTTSGRSSVYMRCIDNNKQSNCSQSVSYALPITKKGVTRSAMSPNGKAIALIDGDGTVYRCDFGAGSVLSDKQEFAKLPGTLIPARACWVSWTDTGALILLDKKGHLRVFPSVATGRSIR